MDGARVSDEEVARRVATLKRLKALLQEQREKFAQYLVVLQQQQVAIEAQDAETVLRHVELEEALLGDVQRVQKALAPMEQLCLQQASGVQELAQLRCDLSRVQEHVYAQNEKNRALLRAQVSDLRQQLDEFRAARGLVSYEDGEDSGTVIDLSL